MSLPALKTYLRDHYNILADPNIPLEGKKLKYLELIPQRFQDRVNHDFTRIFPGYLHQTLIKKLSLYLSSEDWQGGEGEFSSPVFDGHREKFVFTDGIWKSVTNSTPAELDCAW
eukprot:gnl/Spiro4/24189_TR12004_c0_g1_i1.p1 gnl/Spiro4/24189_TR12004_c0_g1~~gnl/Spiro4/24189_TR12004_c0_g1_i1.p1  ORF type:complete len:114 (+),score=28.23 gnl/Spiro4/24189_TR12004_c0_g1_i1:49-390(+)